MGLVQARVTLGDMKSGLVQARVTLGDIKSTSLSAGKTCPDIACGGNSPAEPRKECYPGAERIEPGRFSISRRLVGSLCGVEGRSGPCDHIHPLGATVMPKGVCLAIGLNDFDRCS